MRCAWGRPWLTHPGHNIWNASITTTRPRKSARVTGVCVLNHRDTANGVFDLLVRQVHESGMALVVVTHDPSLAARCERALRMTGGVLSEPGSTSPG